MIDCQKHLFDLPEEVSYLNCAYMSPLTKSVMAAGQKAIKEKMVPYTIKTQDFFTPIEELKAKFARIIHLNDPERIAIIPSVSYGMANVAANVQLSGKDNIVLIEEQFPSNVYVWIQKAQSSGASIKFVKAPQNILDRARAWNQKILDAINENTKLIALAPLHWADGTIFNLESIRKKTRAVGALMVIDGSQSVGALPFDVGILEPDALICAGYKWLMGPYGLGLGYYGTHFDEGKAIEESWINRLNSYRFDKLVHYQEKYKPKAARYSVGEQSNFILIPILSAAIDQLLAWEVETIQSYCRKISKEYLAYLKTIGCVIDAEDYRAGHLFGIRWNDAFDTEKLKNEFDKQKVYVSFRGQAVRVSPHIYNNTKDLEKLVSCFERAKK